ncbi:MAG: glutamate-5-semialdehyde dehydrogenase [bacterium]
MREELLAKTIEEIGIKAKETSYRLARATTSEKNNALEMIADGLRSQIAEIIRENRKDIDQAKEKGLSSSMLDRLSLDEHRINQMISSIEQIIALPDPVGEISNMSVRPNGLKIGQMRVPLGVVGFIYESRPNVTIDAAALCLKAGCVIILKGGSEAINSNMYLTKIIQQSIKKAGLPIYAVQILTSTDHQAVNLLVKLNKYVDVIVPRGGRTLIEAVTANATIPVIKHFDGICHIFIDQSANEDMAMSIVVNAKVQRPGVCNALETLLIDTKIAQRILPGISDALKNEGVELRGCERARKIVSGLIPATEKDWSTEYLDLILSIRIVDTFDEAVKHINTYGSSHTDAIITDNYPRAMRFLQEVDSACVFVNASTRFSDGFEFGLGAELGISTDKFHVRGPMGLVDLTCKKYIAFGSGQVRE